MFVEISTRTMLEEEDLDGFGGFKMWEPGGSKSEAGLSFLSVVLYFFFSLELYGLFLVHVVPSQAVLLPRNCEVSLIAKRHRLDRTPPAFHVTKQSPVSFF